MLNNEYLDYSEGWVSNRHERMQKYSKLAYSLDAHNFFRDMPNTLDNLEEDYQNCLNTYKSAVYKYIDNQIRFKRTIKAFEEEWEVLQKDNNCTPREVLIVITFLAQNYFNQPFEEIYEDRSSFVFFEIFMRAFFSKKKMIDYQAISAVQISFIDLKNIFDVKLN